MKLSLHKNVLRPIALQKLEGSHSGQLRGTRNPEGAIPTQVQILYPPQIPWSLTFAGQG